MGQSAPFLPSLASLGGFLEVQIPAAVHPPFEPQANEGVSVLENEVVQLLAGHVRTLRGEECDGAADKCGGGGGAGEEGKVLLVVPGGHDVVARGGDLNRELAVVAVAEDEAVFRCRTNGNQQWNGWIAGRILRHQIVVMRRGGVSC